MSKVNLDLFRNYVFGKLINKQIDLSFLSGVLYQDKFFIRKEYEDTKDKCYEYSWRAKEELDENTYNEVVKVFNELALLIEYESITYEFFEEIFFSVEHIRKD